ncbi:DUF6701 domain-containing protein [Oceanisphaera pacifica]|uniref:DUF6701 domain-containing protein n=1 Tax=Oceanisphaera pacifica TaxID=2818389 RepID=A0ABS3NDV4_9GAMM|nr:DUF6701 domain-containing protein [Oceanisphaera pacifica]MBO1518769.1 hypothetical protein [Oceanisphaera pacifica]
MLRIVSSLSASLLAVLITTQPASAIDIDNSALFPAVAQGHSCNGRNVSTQLDMQDDTQINNLSGQPLDFCSQDIQDGKNKCDGKKCYITGDANEVEKIDSNVFNFNESADNKKPWPGIVNKTIRLTSGDYEVESLDYQDYSELSFDTDGKVRIFVKDSFTVQDSNLFFTGDIDFYVKDDFDFQDSTIILDGNVNVFVKDSFKFDKSMAKLNGTLHFYLKQSVGFDDAVVERSLGSEFYVYAKKEIKIQGESSIDGYIYTGDDLDLQDDVIINGRVTAKRLLMEDNAVINGNVQSTVEQCFFDDFNQGGSINDSWARLSNQPDFSPSIVDKRLRLTEGKQRQAMAISYQKVFPAKNNRFVVEFDHYAWVEKDSKKTSNEPSRGADGIALVFSDTAVKPKPGADGGPLGYGFRKSGANASDGFAGGWMAIGIDEYGNFIREGGDVQQSRQQPHSVVLRGSGSKKSGYNVLASDHQSDVTIDSKRECFNWEWSWGWKCVEYSSEPRPHRYQVTFDSTVKGKALVTVKRNKDPNHSQDYEDVLINELNVLGLNGQAELPESFYFTITGSTGGSVNIHELDNTSICAARINDVDVQIDHFRFDFAEQTTPSCREKQVTITACVSEDCATKYNKAVSVVLDDDYGALEWTGGNEVTFKRSTSLSLKGLKDATLDILSSNPDSALLKDTLCKVGNSGYSQGNCKILFSSEGKELKLTIDDAYAGQVVEATLEPQDACAAMYEGEDETIKDVTFKMSHSEPEELETSPSLTITNKSQGTNKDENHELKQGGSITVKDVVFGKDGKATVSFLYPEAGKNNIEATVVGEAISGASSLVTVPKGLCVASQGQCSDADASCPPFVAAGEDFALNIKAYGFNETVDDACSMPALQNYVQDVDLSLNLLAPSGEELGEIKPSPYTHTADSAVDFKNSTEEMKDKGVTVAISEVGVFEVIATPQGKYLGSDLPIEAGTSQPIGRFYPERFVLYNGTVESDNGDTTQSYMDQTFDINFDLRAENKAEDPVKNYVGAFAKGNVTLNTWAKAKVELNDWVNDQDYNHRIHPKLHNVSNIWSKGELNFSRIKESKFIRNNGSPDGPYELDFELDFNDGEKTKDGKKAELSKLFDTRGSNVDNNCSQSTGCNKLLLGKQTVSHGQIEAPDASGPVNEALSAPLQIQYWNSQKGTDGGWDDFSEDNWTTLTMTDKVSFPEHNYTHPTLVVNGQVNVDAGLDRGTATGTGEKAVMEAGLISLNVGAPGVASTIKYQLNLNGLPWLKPLGDAATEGQIRFGNSPGNSSVIYRREQ